MRKRRLRVAAVAVVVLLLAGVAGVVVYTAGLLGDINRVKVSLESVGNQEPQNFLIVGSDSRGQQDPVAPGDEQVTGQRADTIVIARVDPKKTSVEIMSIPRDLWLTRSDGKTGRLNAAYADGPQKLIDTITKNFAIPINHYVEVNFDGFTGLVKAVGGVPLYFDRPVRDSYSGLSVSGTGCIRLSPEMGLAFARSRHLEYQKNGKWVSDPTGDEGRITRQQIFIRRAMKQATALGLGDVGKMRDLIDVGVKSVKLDQNLGVSDLLDLGKQFSNFDPATMVSHRLPTTPTTTSGGAAVLKVDETAAAPVIALFKGEAGASSTTTTGPAVTTTLAPVDPDLPQNLSVNVESHTGTAGFAAKVAAFLNGRGFSLGAASDLKSSSKTMTALRYNPDDANLAQQVVTVLGLKIRPTPDPSVAVGTAVLTVGPGFRLPAGGATASSTVPAPTMPTTTKPPGGVPADERQIGQAIGDPPPGIRCE
jgi:LCP family protein required for cell wall assembly